MSRQIRMAIVSFGRGMSYLGAGWNLGARRSPSVRLGIGRHFASVGKLMNAAALRFMECHPEIKGNA